MVMEISMDQRSEISKCLDKEKKIMEGLLCQKDGETSEKLKPVKFVIAWQVLKLSFEMSKLF